MMTGRLEVGAHVVRARDLRRAAAARRWSPKLPVRQRAASSCFHGSGCRGLLESDICGPSALSWLADQLFRC
ncbi:hypothetical protein NDU88_008060 [Pleurodeles waltl]|uniref:Uncharacterized protein n=1 Tax=Pleurodeles waltl TaxID=8319 RepID=A0AAV7NWQ3_PLEWA|nr:hypothetical protein NDU88_008060 [Pleurodeles waltl]